MRVVHFFDKLAFRTPRKLGKADMAFLRLNARKRYHRLGQPIRNANLRWLLVVVAPNDAALNLIAKRRYLVVNCVEVARDELLQDARSALTRRDEYDRHFVQRHHGKRETTAVDNVTRTDAGRRAGVSFAWYADRPSKVTGHRHCFHIEGRYQGVRAVRRLGINAPADLTRFDHLAYWTRHDNRDEVDRERLGRWHLNCLAGSRRQKLLIKQYGRFRYNVDRAVGCALYRMYAETDAFARFCAQVDRPYPEDVQHPDKRTIEHCTQKFIDTYGRGPYLRRRP